MLGYYVIILYTKIAEYIKYRFRSVLRMLGYYVIILYAKIAE